MSSGIKIIPPGIDCSGRAGGRAGTQSAHMMMAIYGSRSQRTVTARGHSTGS